MLSIPHMLVVFVIVLVVFGPQKLPELARSLGKMLAEFRKASTDFKSAFEEEMKDLERQAREVERKKAADAAAKAADEAPVQAATFATVAGTDTPALESGAAVTASDSGAASGVVNATGEVAAVNHATADAFGEPIDARVTEGTAELAVSPVVEAVVARTGSLDFDGHANATIENEEARVADADAGIVDGAGATEADIAQRNGDGSSTDGNVKHSEGVATGVDLPS
ncbi:MAG: twin-arginine translocase TatA/TatE family subunit [Candidatus Acidiferrum sp.]